MSESESLEGQTLGSYRLISSIGAGGMGTVYRAEHVVIGRPAAVKVLNRGLLRDPEVVNRFINEARAAASLRHPSVVDILDLGHSEDGGVFIVMELLVGESLAERLERDARFTIETAAAITRQVASALQAAHEHGIVHRDLKPENIFLVEDAEAPLGQRAKVLDFGIAKLAPKQAARSVKTQTGAMIGTPRYMSPEQCKSAADVDARADIYSLGCILFEMLVGVAPFDYDGWAELVAAHIHEAPPRLRELDLTMSEAADTIVSRSLAKAAGDRYQTMSELSEAVEELWRPEGGRPLATPARGVRAVVRPTTDAAIVQGDDPTYPRAESAPIVAKRAATAPVVPAAHAPTVPQTPAAIAGSRRWLVLAIAGGVLLIAGVGVVAVLALLAAKQPPQDGADPVYIVETHGSSRSIAPAVDAGAATVVADAAVPVDARPSSPPLTPEQRQVQLLDATFRAHMTGVKACFASHPDAVGELSLRFEIDGDGKVVAAQVLPATIGGTDLGACLVASARDIAFGHQPAPTAFKIALRH